MALTARSLHCRGSVRLQSYIPCANWPVSTPARDRCCRKRAWECRRTV